jgi:hypothetical protein
MNLVSELLKEHSKAQTSKIVAYVGRNSQRFAKLVDVYLKGPYRVTQRAAWPLSYCAIENPKIVTTHLKKLLAYAARPDVHPAVKRNTVRFLQFIPIPKSHQGNVVNLCFMFLSNPKEPIAVRVFAMTVLSNLANENKDLKNEIIPLIEDHLPFSSAGFRHRSLRILKQLKS